MDCFTSQYIRFTKFRIHTPTSHNRNARYLWAHLKPGFPKATNESGLIGGDVVEVSPPFDPTGNTALVGATMLYEIACVLADAVARG